MTVPAAFLIACSDFVVMGFPPGKSMPPKFPSLAPPVTLYDALLPGGAGGAFGVVLAVQSEGGLSYFGGFGGLEGGSWYFFLLGLDPEAGHDGPAHSLFRLCLSFQWCDIMISLKV